MNVTDVVNVGIMILIILVAMMKILQFSLIQDVYTLYGQKVNGHMFLMVIVMIKFMNRLTFVQWRQ